MTKVRTPEYIHLQVQGAGELEVGTKVTSTGTAVGLHFGVSWGSHGYAGGVMDYLELCRLIDHLRAMLPVCRKAVYLNLDRAANVLFAVECGEADFNREENEGEIVSS